MPRDYYEVLGVPKSATPDQIKKAYRKLAQQYHPDRNPGDKAAEAQFKEVNEAHEVLSDAKRKQMYDQYGHAGAAGGFPHSPNGFPNWGAPGGGPQVDPRAAQELFEQFMGGQAGGFDANDFFGPRPGRRGARRRPEPPPVQEHEITVPFDVAANGGTVSLAVGGKTIDVKIPAGFEDGKKLRLPAAATGSVDVLLTVRVAPHAYFRREGSDVLLDVPISLSEAVLGGSVEVPTVSGDRLTVKVPAGTSGGGRVRLRGKGIKGGDQYLVFQVAIPKGIDAESRGLIEEFARRNPADPRANVSWG